eukprot:PhF_6_TR22503/c0_g1_i2/m.31909
MIVAKRVCKCIPYAFALLTCVYLLHSKFVFLQQNDVHKSQQTIRGVVNVADPPVSSQPSISIPQGFTTQEWDSMLDKVTSNLTSDWYDRTAAVARLIYNQQHPEDCTKARLLVLLYRNTGCGVGCQLLHVVSSLKAAILMNRTLVVPENNWRSAKGTYCLDSDGFECYFKPISPCRVTHAEVAEATKKRYRCIKPLEKNTPYVCMNAFSDKRVIGITRHDSLRNVVVRDAI